MSAAEGADATRVGQGAGRSAGREAVAVTTAHVRGFGLHHQGTVAQDPVGDLGRGQVVGEEGDHCVRIEHGVDQPLHIGIGVLFGARRGLDACDEREQCVAVQV